MLELKQRQKMRKLAEKTVADEEVTDTWVEFKADEGNQYDINIYWDAQNGYYSVTAYPCTFVEDGVYRTDTRKPIPLGVIRKEKRWLLL